MSEKMNMSLDDIIKSNKDSYHNKKKGINFKRKFIDEEGKTNNNNFRNRHKFFKRDYKAKDFESKVSNYKNRNENFKNNKYSSNNEYVTKKNVDSENNKTRLIISSLDKSIINSELRALFEKCGPLKRCGIHWDDLGNSLGTADVEFFNPEDAKLAIKEYHKALINEHEVNIEYAGLGNSNKEKNSNDNLENKETNNGNFENNQDNQNNTNIESDN